MDSATRKQFRQIAHHLRPVIIIGDGGLSDGVVAETNRALEDHELIKVKINVLDRNERNLLAERLLETCVAESVQLIGKVLVIYRRNEQAKVQLSNVARARSS